METKLAVGNYVVNAPHGHLEEKEAFNELLCMFKKEESEQKKPTVLVLGLSGHGKSSLIKAVFGFNKVHTCGKFFGKVFLH